VTRRQTASIVFVVLCILLVAAAVTLNIGWIIVNGRRVAPVVLGVTTFGLIIAGLIVYTVFLVREMGITEQQDSFLNSVTHELKTPIASIRLYLETLQSREVGDAQRKEFYRIMLQDADRLQHTVEQVLRAGVARQKRRLEHRGPVDLGWLVQECVDTARTRHHLSEDAITVVESDLRVPLVVSGEVDDLRTAVNNLLDNAVKYSGGVPQITVQAAGPTPDTAWVRVKDAGIGIPKAQLGRIFNRFYRFQPRGSKIKGTGLGLYIVRSIAKRHGGRVFAESAGEEKGATFTLELPRVIGPIVSEPPLPEVDRRRADRRSAERPVEP
jgi:two-component system, OmpR family, sensor histidine kinase SenX3